MEKTADRVTIKNKGQVLYNQAFSDNDANCRQATTTVKTQVWNYDDSLGLAVFDNSAPRKCCCFLLCSILFNFLLGVVHILRNQFLEYFYPPPLRKLIASVFLL